MVLQPLVNIATSVVCPADVRENGREMVKSFIIKGLQTGQTDFFETIKIHELPSFLGKERYKEESVIVSNRN